MRRRLDELFKSRQRRRRHRTSAPGGVCGLELLACGGTRYCARMTVDNGDTGPQGPHLAERIEEFRAAQQRRLVRLGIRLWNRTEAQLAMTPIEKRPELLDRAAAADEATRSVVQHDAHE